MSTVKACIFCDIIAGKSPDTTIEFSNEHIVIFKDIRPASDFHFLAVPKKHMPNVRACTMNDKDLSMLSSVLLIFIPFSMWKRFKKFSICFSFFELIVFVSVLEMQNELRNLFSTKNVNLDDISYGFHWPPFTSITHLHMHGIAPASKMGFIARQIFKPINMWYCTVSLLERKTLNVLKFVLF